MCGICGIVNYNKRVDAEAVKKMCAAMRHRGPDGDGIYTNPSQDSTRVILGHSRLKIIDLSKAGHQPMSNEDNSIWIVFNGEVYNFRELRKELEGGGHIFKSNTDTEAILHLYEEHGASCVKYLRGMFAFAVWDEKKEILLLARDRIGKKPLIYSYNDKSFCFASEFLPLFESNLVKKEINYEAVDYYLTFGYIPAPLTIYKGVFKLLPAHTLVLKNNEIKTDRYWQINYENKINISEVEAQEEVLRILKEAVRIRLFSDVPLGAFLSGGIDSSTIVALMTKLSSARVKTFSIGFNENNYNELKYARGIANRFNTEHNEFIVKPDALRILPLLVERYGEPYADSSCIPTYYVAQQTKQFVTVALNGDGGDELFAGYERYQAMLAAEIYRKLPVICKNILLGCSHLLPDSINQKNRLRNIKRFLQAASLPAKQRYLRWVGIFDSESKESLYTQEFKGELPGRDAFNWLNPYLEESGNLSLLDRLLMTDTNTYLPNDLLVKVDIACMANSLEARSPFLDHKLIEFVASLPVECKMKNFSKKYLLKSIIKGLVPKENINRRKMGFGIPVGEWFRDELKSFLYETLFSKTSSMQRYFRTEVIKNMVNRHIKKQADYTFQLWALLMFELWHTRFILNE